MSENLCIYFMSAMCYDVEYRYTVYLLNLIGGRDHHGIYIRTAAGTDLGTGA